MFTDVIILAGGFGERLWPASKADFPKQFMSLKDNLSFLQNAIIRSLKLKISGKIIIATRTGLEQQISLQCKDLCERLSKDESEKIKNDILILAEPTPRHTTAPVILSCYLMNILNPETKHSFLVITSDHIIEPIDSFCLDVQKAYNLAKENSFICFGIKPYEPATGYGYIQTETALDNEKTCFKIKNFKEKPDAVTAQKYLDSGNCWWNSGMFGFMGDFFINELKKCTPEIYESFCIVANGNKPEINTLNEIKNVSFWKEMNEAYSKTPAIAIDKSVAEKTNNSCIVIASFNWEDIGSWDSFEKHSDGQGKTAFVNSNNCFVYSDIPVAICGIDDISVIIKNGKALVMKKGCSPLVRDASKELE